MAYRSEVAVAIKKDYYEMFLNGKTEKSKRLISDLISYGITTEHEDGVLIHWSSIKWYNDADVFEFMKSLKAIGEDNYYFVEIGQDFDDTNFYGFWSDNSFDLYVTRTLHMST